MATFEELKNFVQIAEKAIKKGTLTEVSITTKFVNKNDDKDIFETFEQAFERGVDLSMYEKRTEKSGIKYDLEQLIDKKDIDVLRRFITIVDSLNTKAEQAEKVEPTEKPINIGTLNQRLNKLYKEFDEAVGKGIKEEIKTIANKIEEELKKKGDKLRITKRVDDIRKYVQSL